MSTFEQAVQADRAHVFHSWSAQDHVSPLPIAGGSGAHFWDPNGKKYLDFSSQLVNLNLGHQHPRLIESIKRQAETVATVAPAFANDTRSELARLICDAAPQGFEHVFFTNGGADANENAVRMARLHTGRRKVLSAYRSYHGATSTAISLTGDPRRWANEPSDSSVVHFIGPYPYRSAFYAESPEQETERALAHLRATIELEGPDTISAIILETIVGTNGILIPPPGFLPGVRKLCDEFGILYIADEVMAGFGRTGKMFAFEHFDVVPDLITFAKGVNSGYVPLGGVVISDPIYQTFTNRVFPGGLTYSGHPLACAPGVETFKIFEEERVLEHVNELADAVIRPRLEEFASRNPLVGEVRGLGFFWAIELVSSKETKDPLVPFNASGPAAKPMTDFTVACKEKGLWPFTHFNRVHITPPLVTTKEELERGLDITFEVLDDLASKLS
ncbi:5-aminovalerate aminotransferase DavT [Corynebacterium kalinowskii]|uniref:5-aminovalerate aminotransferase DavT n=1 Tax=Corynebacterium kalinowskii TaxID=2675216 RepID=A0A6B8VPN9_9CORY|nr:aspartate aminotransferase family protein [Corynebacterium kalinowskii]QGU01527.1 5-aminovalerate aminotransferase DavT [Corynebacterium kalinowskii]